MDVELETFEEGPGQLLTEERYIWFQDAGLEDVVLAVVIAVVLARPRPSRRRRATFSLQRPRGRAALWTPRDCFRFHGRIERSPIGAKPALLAHEARPAAVALDQLLARDADVCLDVVDVLRVVGQELGVRVEELDKGVGGC